MALHVVYHESLDAEVGFEPTLAGPTPAVLPLDDSAMVSSFTAFARAGGNMQTGTASLVSVRHLSVLWPIPKDREEDRRVELLRLATYPLFQNGVRTTMTVSS